jgi:dihydroflavonol-4-reductase
VKFEKILVTGASGLLGSNICKVAAEQGKSVRGMVRKPADADVLKSLGIEPVLGDVTDIDSMRRAAEGVDGVIHSAAIIGGTWSKATPEEFEEINYKGAINALDAARDAGAGRTVLIGTLAIIDMAYTITERSPMIQLSDHVTGYSRAKLASYFAGMHRACRGEDIVFVFPGAMYGPSPFVDRALEPTLFTGSLYLALTGKLKKYVHFPLTWPYVEDVARIAVAALDKGRNGHRYLGGGRAEDKFSLAQFCNMGCEQAGVAHRVKDLQLADMADEIGSMRAMAALKFADPLIDPTETTRALGVELTPVEVGIAKTLQWLRDNGRI